MPTPTITFRSNLTKQAKIKAERMGVPLSLVLNNALRNFLNADNMVILGNPRLVELPVNLQKKADSLGKFTNRAVAKKHLVNVQATVWKEGKYYVSQCLNVDVASFGATKKEALVKLEEALALYLEDTRTPALSKVERPDIVSLKLQHA